MPIARRDETVWQAGSYYHLYNRGARQLSIFRESDNYVFALRCVKNYLVKLDLTVIAYCLMPNHYHFLIHQNGTQPVGYLIQYTFNSYTKAYNKRYEHSGTLFERRFKAKQITNDAHLLQLCRYIHANPVKHGMTTKLNDWPYSNYLEWIGGREGTLVDHDFITSHFSSAAEYEIFVLDYLRTRQLPDEISIYLEHDNL